MSHKTLYHPLTGQPLKMGLNRSNRPHCKAAYSDLKAMGFVPTVPVPQRTNYAAGCATALADILGNNVLGDCFIAASLHADELVSSVAGAPVVYTTDQAIQAYSGVGGYVLGQPSTDNGCDAVTGMNFWETRGLPSGVKAAYWIEVDGTNWQEVREAFYMAKFAILCAEMPDAYIDPPPSGPGFIWDVAGDPNPENGHAKSGIDLSPSGIEIDTWGIVAPDGTGGLITPGALAKYYTPAANGGIFVALFPDIIEAQTGVDPDNFPWSDLLTYLKQLPAVCGD